LNDLAAAMHQACLRDLPPIEYVGYDPAKAMSRRPEPYDLYAVEMWQQTWGSTALGFGGIGGAAMTEATVILVWGHNRNGVSVYFGGRHAYTILRPNDKFREDHAKRRLGDVSGYAKRYEDSP
jgi:hypothetical protein